mgnify:CR=1 FL=1
MKHLNSQAYDRMRHGGFVRRAEVFDARYFAISPAEASALRGFAEANLANQGAERPGSPNKGGRATMIGLQQQHAQLSQPSAAPAPVPAPKPHNPAWTEQVNPENSQKYYWNSQTGESTYSRPADYNPPPGSRVDTGGEPQQKGPPGANLFVVRKMRKGEYDEFNNADLRSEFSKFGTVTRAEMTIDKETGWSKGFGFVSFASVQEADAALAQVHGSWMAGREMKVEKTRET